MKKLDHHTMGDDELVSMFEQAFESQIAKQCDIPEYSVSVVRNTSDEKLSFEVDISGMAGTPSVDDFKNNKVKGAKVVTISRADKGELKLTLVPSLITFLSGNDYLLVYSAG